MSATPCFSILVPTYNHAKFVGAALDSLLAQTERDWEAVVVNDGSTDNTADVLNAYAQRDPRIRVFPKPNGGTGSALNRALAEARGDWICWLSSDDFFGPKKLAIHRDWFRREPTCRFFFTYFRLFNQGAGVTVDHELWGPLPEREFQVLGLFYRNYISGISVCIHREAWRAVGNFNERLRYAQDYDMWLRLLARHPATFIPEWTCISRQHPGQGSEVFHQACYYDTAAAGIQFLHDHRFEDLFPMLDLSDPSTALRAVERALSQAADDSAFLYWYGAHPNLLSRTLQWAWDERHGKDVFPQRGPVRQLAQQMLADYARQLRDTPLGWHWRVALAACKLPEPNFDAMLMTPREVGTSFVYDRRAKGESDLPDLERYFQMQYGVGLPAAPPKHARRTVILCDLLPSFAPASVDLAQQLRSAGCQVVTLGNSAAALCLEHGMPRITADAQTLTAHVLPELLPIDAIVWNQTPPNATSFIARQHYDASEFRGDESILRDRILSGQSAATPNTKASRTATAHHRRKVVFISSSPWGGGAERVTHTLLHALDPSKYDSHFVYLTRNPGPQADFDPSITLHSVEDEMHRLGSKRRPLWKRPFNRLARILRWTSDQCTSIATATAGKHLLDAFSDSIQLVWPQVVALADILHRIGSDALLVPVMEEAAVRVWLAQSLGHQPYCAWLHTAESRALPLMFPQPERLAAEKFLLASACRSAAAVVFPSAGCRTDFSEHFDVPVKLIDVIPNPIDIDAVLRASCETPEIPIPPLRDKCLFVHAARLSIEKNHDLLLDACFLLKDQNPHFVVLCLGDGARRQEIACRIRERGLEDNVLLLGAVKNPFPYLARAQGLVLTSQFESFALVLVEALACGAVPVAVDCPYGPRLILENGKYGLLTPEDDASALAAAMRRVADDRALRQHFRQLASARARCFDLSRVISQWETLIDQLLHQNSIKLAA